MTTTPHTDGLRFGILGPVAVTYRGQSVPLGGHRQSVLLGILLANDPRSVSMDGLIAAIWDDAPDTARRQVQNLVSALRRTFHELGLEEPVIVAEHAGYRVRSGAGTVDATVFAEHVTAAQRLANAGDPAAATACLNEGLALWRGPALLGLGGGRIVAAAAARLDEQRVSAIELRFELELALGHHADVIGELVEMVAAHPFRERLVGQLMLAFSRCGRQAEAIHTYHRLREHLADELGVDPGEAVRRIYNTILHSSDEVPAAVPIGEPAHLVPNEAAREAARDTAPEPTPPSARPAERPGAGPGRPARATVPAQRSAPQPPAARVDGGPAPAQLPADLGVFTGRAAHLRVLDEALATTSLTAIAGMAGVGKTTLAVHWAHRVRHHFPDGQLFADLGGYGPDEPPRPSRVLDQLLYGLGVPAEQVPADLPEAVGLYRSLLADRRVLILLDNAYDADQVVSLLPGSPGCFLVVTSRNQLTGLAVTTGARILTVDAVGSDEARSLLAKRVGQARVGDEVAAADRIVELCGRLPLALAIVAARITAHPGMTLRQLADELADAQDPLDLLDGGAPVANLRAVLSWSYDRLGQPAARLFRLLGLHPGPVFDLDAAASLAGTAVGPTRRDLAELTSANLVAEPTAGEFRLHDLIRVYAHELVTDDDPRPDRDSALTRMFDHYLHTAAAAGRLVDPARRVPESSEPADGTVVVEITDPAAALGWFEAKRATLIAVLERAAKIGYDGHAWRLARAFGPLLDGTGFWRDSVVIQEIGIAAARRAGERAAEANIRRNLVISYGKLRRVADAEAQARAAGALYRELGDTNGEAFTRLSLGGMYEAAGRLTDALAEAESAQILLQESGDARLEGFVFINLAHVHAVLGNHERALACCERALESHRDIGPIGRAGTLDSRGLALTKLGNHHEAVASHREAADIFYQLGHHPYEGQVRVNLGDAYAATGNMVEARRAWEQALDIYERLSDVELADGVRAKLGLAPAPAQVNAPVGF